MLTSKAIKIFGKIIWVGNRFWVFPFVLSEFPNEFRCIRTNLKSKGVLKVLNLISCIIMGSIASLLLGQLAEGTLNVEDMLVSAGMGLPPLHCFLNQMYFMTHVNQLVSFINTILRYNEHKSKSNFIVYC